MFKFEKLILPNFCDRLKTCLRFSDSVLKKLKIKLISLLIENTVSSSLFDVLLCKGAKINIDFGPPSVCNTVTDTS